MKTRLYHFWDNLISSYWFIPGLMLLSGAGLAHLTLAIDRWIPEAAQGWFYTSGTDGALTLLSTAGGSVMTVAAVVFSITIAALTQASTQFGPRLLRNFMRDTGNQVVLGTFVATFLYDLLILRKIPSSSEGAVPHFSVTVAVALGVGSLCVLVYFIHHVSLSIQAPHVIAKAWEEFTSGMSRRYPNGMGQIAPVGVNNEATHLAWQREEGRSVKALCSGYLQAVEGEKVIEYATRNNIRLRILRRPGQFVLSGSALAFVFPKDGCSDQLAKALSSAFMIGHQRTAEQDVEFAINQMVEIAVRALSPGINDPFTALTCIDWLSDAIRQVAADDTGTSFRYDGHGVLRVVTEVSSFEGIADAAFNQIRQYGSRSISVTLHLLEAIARIAPHLRTKQQRQALLNHGDKILRQSEETFVEESDRQNIRDRFQAMTKALAASVQ